MDRREQIENIIIGTLLNSDENNDFFESVKYCVTSDMFSDSRRSKIFDLIKEMNSKGIKRTYPDAIYDYCNQKLSKEQLSYLLELAIDWHFLMKKVEYNERVWMSNSNIHKRYTSVTFDDYVSRFVKMAFNDERKNNL